MTYADGQEVLAPKQLIIPDITNRTNISGQTVTHISGSVCISGQSLVVWMGSWRYISGATVKRNL